MFEDLIGKMSSDPATRMKLMELAEKRAMLYATLGMYNTMLAAAYRGNDEDGHAAAREYYTTNKVDDLKKEIDDLRHNLLMKGVFDSQMFTEMLPMAGVALGRAFDLGTLFDATETSPDQANDIVGMLQRLLSR